MEKIVLIGGGGHCKVIIDIINSTKKYEIVGICDRVIGSIINGVEVIGNDDILPQLYKDGVKNSFICIGGIGNPQKRINIQNNLKKIGFNLPSVIHSNAILGSEVYLGEGTCVMAGAIINASAKIGELGIINTGAVIEHDCNIENNVHISPRACLCGGVNVGFNTHIGAGATVNHLVKIGNNVIVGSGSVVTKDIKDRCTVVGVPYKIIKEW